MGRFLLSLSNAFSEKYLRSDQIDAFVQSESRSLLGEIRQKGFFFLFACGAGEDFAHSAAHAKFGGGVLFA